LIKIILFLYESIIFPSVDFCDNFIPKDTDKDKFLNPIHYIGAFGLIVILLMICFIQIFAYGYYWILLAIYRTRFLDPTDEQIQWSKESNLSYYNFIPFYDNDVLLFNKTTKYFIGFRKKNDAVYFKMNSL